MAIELPDRLTYSRSRIDLEDGNHGGIGESQANLALRDYFKDKGWEYTDLGVTKDSNARGSDFAFLVRESKDNDWEIIIGDNKDYGSPVSASTFKNTQDRTKEWAECVIKNPEAIQQFTLSRQFPNLEETGLTAEELLQKAGYKQEQIDKWKEIERIAESSNPNDYKNDVYNPNK